MTAVSEYELAVLNIFIFNMLVFQYVWKYIISVIGTSRLSLSLMHLRFKLTKYEIVYDKYRESLSCPHPPMHDNIVYRRSHRLAIWRYEKWPYRPTLVGAKLCRAVALQELSLTPLHYMNQRTYMQKKKKYRCMLSIKHCCTPVAVFTLRPTFPAEYGE